MNGENQPQQTNPFDAYMQHADAQLEAERLRRQQVENQFQKDSAFQQPDIKTIVEYQLDTNRLLDKAFHLLSGHVLKKDIDGNDVWQDPTDDRLKILSPYGVERIMNLLSLYITPEVITSMFDLDTINREVKDFGIELADLISNRYELFFHFPQPEELYEKLSPLVRERDPSITDEELYLRCVEWSSDELQMKLANYPIIVMSLLAIVHANYRRALNGETLKSLRTMTHISQTIGGTALPQMPMPQAQSKQFSLFKPSTWGKNS